MRRTTKATIAGAAGATVTITTDHELLLLALAAGVLLALAGGLGCLVWAVVFADTDDPTRRFERVTAALAQFAAKESSGRPKPDLARPRSRDAPEHRGAHS